MKLTEAQVARLRSLETYGGRLTPAAVVADAKKKDSPLHSLPFEWNLGKAAYQHWLQVAREVVGSVTVMIEHKEFEFHPTGFFVRDPQAKGQGYRSVEALRNDPDVARESLIETLKVASGHLRRAYDLSFAVGMNHEIDELIQRVVGLQRQIKEAA